MSPSKRTSSSATRRADAHSKAKGAAKKAEKGAVTHLPPESPGNTKIGIPASRWIDWGKGLRLDTLADLIMDESIPLSCWLIAEPPEEERGRKKEKKEKKRKDKKKRLGSDSSLVSSTSKNSLPSACPGSTKTNTVPFPVSTRAEREAVGLYSTTSASIIVSDETFPPYWAKEGALSFMAPKKARLQPQRLSFGKSTTTAVPREERVKKQGSARVEMEETPSRRWTCELPIPPNPNADDPRMAAALQRHYDDDSSDDEDDDTKPSTPADPWNTVPWLTGDDMLRRMRRGDPEDTWERPPGPDDLLEPGEERPALTITAEEAKRLGDYWDRKYPPAKPMPHFATVAEWIAWRLKENETEAEAAAAASAAATLSVEGEQTSEGTFQEASRPETKHSDPARERLRSQKQIDEALRYLNELQKDKPLPPPTNPVAFGKFHAHMRDTIKQVKATGAAREREEPPPKDRGKGKDMIPFPSKPLDRATVPAMPNFLESTHELIMDI
ncbi:hypothetical protein GLOTRDRAFT_93223 [Gloeophyllum trabeum ATCC 11539]|uniref:Uncharacterized protein n=1 Tax=Gloeophyllum trabeum (strain ATCC 11539 / FP-39264 / Madison 617) TaxID=670483 RepID=S7Q6D4_GLOTA|nr:uncharacterized protein GLOTRDRAFT_93223 [Gloeophyllum trabeum ATCC 11539]EPQ55626.1 hypothetical protein GLOTRDRAFT_93223 [Gloeophyllum trabeum ATCC 11539]